MRNKLRTLRSAWWRAEGLFEAARAHLYRATYILTDTHTCGDTAFHVTYGTKHRQPSFVKYWRTPKYIWPEYASEVHLCGIPKKHPSRIARWWSECVRAFVFIYLCLQNPKICISLCHSKRSGMQPKGPQWCKFRSWCDIQITLGVSEGCSSLLTPIVRKPWKP